MTAALLILAGLVLLTAGGESLVRGASNIALRLGISPFVIGLTVVGFGTSAPELGASIAASLADASDIAVGNVVGSNIFNIAVILGLTGLVAPMAIDRLAVRRELIWTVAAGCVPWLALLSAGDEPRIGRPMAGVLIAGIGAYLIRAFLIGRRDPTSPEPAMEAEIASLAGPAIPPDQPPRLVPSLVFVVVGMALLMVGSKLLVDGAIDAARALGVSELMIGLTIVAAGTSVPELVTSFIAAIRKKPELALGNVLGSNVFNSFAILGITSMVVPQRVVPQTLRLDTPVMLGLSLLLAGVCMFRSTISRKTGGLLLLVYCAYIVVLLRIA